MTSSESSVKIRGIAEPSRWQRIKNAKIHLGELIFEIGKTITAIGGITSIIAAQTSAVLLLVIGLGVIFIGWVIKDF